MKVISSLLQIVKGSWAYYKSYTSGLEGSSLLEVFTFEKELFSPRQLVKCLTGENLGLVNMAGYSPGSSLDISQCHTTTHCGSWSWEFQFCCVFLSEVSAVCLAWNVLQKPDCISTVVVFVSILDPDSSLFSMGHNFVKSEGGWGTG